VKCQRCETADANKGTLCGICEIIVSRKCPGLDVPSLVPPHFNMGLGEQIEDKAHLKRRLRELEKQGKIEGSDA